MTERVPDQQCPKCGHDGVDMEYCLGGRGAGSRNRGLDLCMWGDPEHFHRNCLRCGFWWRTDDVIESEASE